jgi:CBS domain containing-hemolysin-like protein
LGFACCIRCYLVHTMKVMHSRITYASTQHSQIYVFFFFSLMLRFPKREAPSISFLWGLLLSENCGVTLFPETVYWANKRYLVCFSLRIVYSFIIIVVLMVLLLSPLYSLLNQLLVTAPRVYLCILFSTLSSAIRKP